MKAALLTEINAPLKLAEVGYFPPQAGQVAVRVLASGICGKQLGEIAGNYDINAPRPRLLGHEGVGIVHEIWPGSTKFREGQKVIMHWRKGSGMESEPPRYAYDGKTITSGQVTTFSEFSVCSENRLTVVPDDVPNDLCALLGCGLSTALGVMENEAQLKMGESVLIVGCGGVGLNLIRVAKMMGASVLAVESSLEPAKRAQAINAGADWVTLSLTDVKEPFGFHVIVDTTGNPGAIADAAGLLLPSGRMILVGQPKSGLPFQIANARHLFDGEGKSIKATQGGGFNPDTDIPRYVAAWRSGHLKIDGIVTHRFPLDQINTALDTVRSGQAGRVMIEMQ